MAKVTSICYWHFIIGIGTSLPELISGIIAVNKSMSEILPGNVIGANISNILLITGIAVVMNKKTLTLSSSYIYIDLHFLVASFIYFGIIAFDGKINAIEAFMGIPIFITYAFHLIKGEDKTEIEKNETHLPRPVLSFVLLLLASAGIYFGAEYTILNLNKLALNIGIPSAIVSLTLLSLGTTLPELAVNISAIKQGKAEMAVGNVLGSCIFNSLIIPSTASFFGTIDVPNDLVKFALPMMATCGVLFYMLTQDKRISNWEGILLIMLYGLFLIKTIGF